MVAGTTRRHKLYSAATGVGTWVYCSVGDCLSDAIVLRVQYSAWQLQYSETNLFSPSGWDMN